MAKTEKIIIGRSEYIKIVGCGDKKIPAKIDTGADSSSIWASKIFIDDQNLLHFTLFGEGSEFYTGETIVTDSYAPVFVRSSNGTGQIRYRVRISVIIKGRRVRAAFTLSDRSKNKFPILIGCRLLQGKFLVDVSERAIKIVKDKAEKALVQSIFKEMRKNPRAFFEKYHKDNHRGDIEL